MNKLSQLQLKLEREKIKREEAEFVLAGMADLQKKSSPREIISELQVVLRKTIPFEKSYIFSMVGEKLVSQDGLSSFPAGNLIQKIVVDKSVRIIYQTSDIHELPFLESNGSAILFTLEACPENNFLIVLFHPDVGHFSHRSASVIKKLSVLIYDALVRVTHIKSLEKLNQEIVEKQQQLISSAKLITIGEIAAGVAHEINNPLAIISGRVEQLQRALGENVINRSLFETSLSNMLETVGRIKAIVDALLHLSQGGAAADVSIRSIQKIIRDVLSLHTENMKSLGVKFEYLDNSKNDLHVQCSQILMSQVFMNLISNALYEVGRQKDGWIKVSVDADKSYVTIRFMNSGEPISPENAHKVFQPFFTTRPVGKGVGVGLSISRKYVEQHHGELTYAFENDCINFIVKLPIAN
jgi:signal transduction histidine kinase